MVQKRIVELNTAPELRDDDIFVALDSQLNGTNRASLGLLKQYVLDAVKERETAQLKAQIGHEHLFTQNQTDILTIGRKVFYRCWQGRTNNPPQRIYKTDAPEYYEFVKNGVLVGYSSSLGDNVKLPAYRIGVEANGREWCCTEPVVGEYMKFAGNVSGTYGYVNGGLPAIKTHYQVGWYLSGTQGTGQPWAGGLLASSQPQVTQDGLNLGKTDWVSAEGGVGASLGIQINVGEFGGYLLSRYNSSKDPEISTVAGNKPLVDAIEMSMYVLVKILD